MRRIFLIILVCLVPLVAGCGGSSDSTQSAGEKALEMVEREERAAAKKEKEAEAARKKTEEKEEKRLAELPQPHVPSGPPPKKLVVVDKKTGSGPVAKPGDQITVHYVGVLYENKKPFDANWGNDEPFSFKLGAQGVIEGWEKGLAGMKVGGQRELIIPPGLAYGPQGSFPIPPNATLVFLVELLKVA
ncbi:MAG TPA: FKBP-type peptidyl-prolyl cis-trans isomerase [Solirubrobacterales bacterium]|nr:FKBP-type peptidyl-prolyl cis-trans isomerase [Solirubrobacterales bacterium]